MEGFSFCVLRPAIQKLVDGFFHVCPDLIGGIPFLCSPGCAGPGAEVLFRVEVKHPAAGRSGTGVLTMANPPAFAGSLITYPRHLRANELQGGEPAAQMGTAPLPFHGERRVVRAARDAVLVQRAVRARKRQLVFQRDIGFFKRCILQKVFVDFNAVKSGVSQKGFRVDEGMFLEETCKTGIRALEAAWALSSSGESDFFPIRISG